jgi:hypothetical protein
MPDWALDLARWLAGMGVGGATLVGIVKVLAPHLLSRDLERYKDELRRESEKEIERTRAALAREHVVHDERSRLLIRDQRDAIAAIYEAFGRAAQTHLSLGVVDVFLDSKGKLRAVYAETVQEKLSKSGAALDDFATALLLRGPYLPPALASILQRAQELMEELRIGATMLHMYGTDPDAEGEGEGEEMKEALEKTHRGWRDLYVLVDEVANEVRSAVHGPNSSE